ncbi:MAG: hypothetical protein HYV63_03495 [Candidatus Schekmanbacteria bacterium]|nr:hypothetical protein [Candidatus Schekmanbacteria bacterium]
MRTEGRAMTVGGGVCVTVVGVALAGMMVMGGAGDAAARETVTVVSWGEQSARVASIPGASVAPGDVPGETGPVEILRVDAEQSPAEAAVKLLGIASPRLPTMSYALEGMIRYQQPPIPGFLQMWSVFEDGSRYFTKGMADSGPLARIAGASEWRRYVLPFYLSAESGAPSAVEMEVVLPGGGHVELGPVRLVAFAGGEDPPGVAGVGAGRLADLSWWRAQFFVGGQWWTPEGGGVVGGLAGSLLGIICSILGALGARGKARGLVLGGMRAMAAMGLLAMTAGVAGYAVGQAAAVVYTLLLLGVIAVAVCLSTCARLRRRYEELELRRLQVMG